MKKTQVKPIRIFIESPYLKKLIDEEIKNTPYASKGGIIKRNSVTVTVSGTK